MPSNLIETFYSNRRRMTEPSPFSPRVLAASAFVLFAPVMFSIVLQPGAVWATYAGLLSHLALFLLVPQLRAPEWAKAAGYGWLVLDVTAGVLALNKVPHDIYIYVRLGGHVFAGIWFVSVSWPGSLGVRVSGLIAGGWLFLYTFASPFLPLTALGPNGFVVLIWLALVAWHNGTSSARSSLSLEPGALSRAG